MPLPFFGAFDALAVALGAGRDGAAAGFFRLLGFFGAVAPAAGVFPASLGRGFDRAPFATVFALRLGFFGGASESDDDDDDESESESELDSDAEPSAAMDLGRK